MTSCSPNGGWAAAVLLPTCWQKTRRCIRCLKPFKVSLTAVSPSGRRRCHVWGRRGRRRWFSGTRLHASSRRSRRQCHVWGRRRWFSRGTRLHARSRRSRREFVQRKENNRCCRPSKVQRQLLGTGMGLLHSGSCAQHWRAWMSFLRLHVASWHIHRPQSYPMVSVLS